MSVLSEEQVTVHRRGLLRHQVLAGQGGRRQADAGAVVRGRCVKEFVVLCKDVEEMRETAVKELGLEMKTLKDKAKLLKLLVAFEIAQDGKTGGRVPRQRTSESFTNARVTGHEGGLREEVLGD